MVFNLNVLDVIFLWLPFICAKNAIPTIVVCNTLVRNWFESFLAAVRLYGIFSLVIVIFIILTHSETEYFRIIQTLQFTILPAECGDAHLFNSKPFVLRWIWIWHV